MTKVNKAGRLVTTSTPTTQARALDSLAGLAERATDLLDTSSGGLRAAKARMASLQRAPGIIADLVDSRIRVSTGALEEMLSEAHNSSSSLSTLAGLASFRDLAKLAHEKAREANSYRRAAFIDDVAKATGNHPMAAMVARQALDGGVTQREAAVGLAFAASEHGRDASGAERAVDALVHYHMQHAHLVRD